MRDSSRSTLATILILGMVPLPLTVAVAVECSTAINRLPD